MGFELGGNKIEEPRINEIQLIKEDKDFGSVSKNLKAPQLIVKNTVETIIKTNINNVIKTESKEDETEAHLKKFSALSGDLAKEINLEGKHQDLIDKASKELETQNPELKELKTTDPAKYKSYVIGYTLLSNKDTLLKDNKHLASKFEALESEAKFLPFLCFIPDRKTELTKDFIAKNKDYKKSEKEIKEIVKGSGLKNLEIKNDESKASFVLDNKGEKETIEIDKTSGSMKSQIEKGGYTINKDLDYNTNHKEIGNEKTTKENSINKYSDLKTSLKVPEEMPKIDFDNIGSITFGINDFKRISQNLSYKIQRGTELLKQDETLQTLEELSELGIKDFKDIEKMQESLNQTKEIIETLEIIKQTQIKIEEFEKDKEEKFKKWQLAREEENKESLERLNFLEYIGFTDLIQERVKIIFKNSPIPEVQKFGFDKKNFNLGSDYKRKTIAILNCLLTGEKTSPIDLIKNPNAINGELTPETRDKIKNLTQKQDYFRYEKNLLKFHFVPKNKTNPGEETK